MLCPCLASSLLTCIACNFVQPLSPPLGLCLCTDVAKALQAGRHPSASIVHHPSLQDERPTRDPLHHWPLHQFCRGHEAALGPALGALDIAGSGTPLPARQLKTLCKKTVRSCDTHCVLTHKSFVCVCNLLYT